jgi:hypothetical protein
MNKDSHPEKGVLVLAEGADYIERAEKMALSLKALHAELPIFLLTDPQTQVSRPELFAAISPVPPAESVWLRRILAMQHPPFERTLWLDADTFVCGPLDGVFALLDQYDFAATHAPARKGYDLPDLELGIPEAFFMLNTGVIAYRRNERTACALRLWEEIFMEGRRRFPDHPAFRIDQPSFHWALWKAKAMVYALPAEFNVRVRHPVFLRDRARLIHEVADNLKELAEVYNATMGPRVFPGMKKKTH